MSPSDYFNEVAAENASLATSYPSDLRLAINAIMTLDGFFGSLHAELLQTGKITEPERTTIGRKLSPSKTTCTEFCGTPPMR
jgi:hypothetical protein